ncbi:hypothetical protein ACN38_g9763 [Penicillium nordicum]|uniref:Uncharacterized protein n=1 Tax=Penicillium nordicum TaxID=229535 RepID=A0A0M8NV44_9EURO|nr:hypothetical protein ACN38_g9763 [Penicillium nordicum]
MTPLLVRPMTKIDEPFFASCFNIPGHDQKIMTVRMNITNMKPTELTHGQAVGSGARTSKDPALPVSPLFRLLQWSPTTSISNRRASSMSMGTSILA